MLIKLRKCINKVKFQLVIVSDKKKRNCRVRNFSEVITGIGIYILVILENW